MSPSTRNDRSLDSDPTASAESLRSSALKREIAGIVLLLFAIFLAGALGTEGWRMLGGSTDARTNFGWAGGFLAMPLARILGWPAAAMLPLAPAAHALRLFGRLDQRTDRSWMVFLLGVVILLPIVFGLGEGGLREATGLSSKPITDNSSGMAIFSRYAALYTPAAISSLLAKMAVGRGRRASSASAQATPDSKL